MDRTGGTVRLDKHGNPYPKSKCCNAYINWFRISDAELEIYCSKCEFLINDKGITTKNKFTPTMRKEVNLPDKSILLLERQAKNEGMKLKPFMEKKLIAISMEKFDKKESQLDLLEVIKIDSRKKNKR